MIKTLAVIACGGALGAVMRHAINLLSVITFGHGFPWGTLGVNILGSFIMGIFIAVFAHFWNPSYDMRVFLVTGFLGAFTTFSTFSLDAAALYERGDLMLAAIYIIVSVSVSIAALFAGMALIRSFAV